MPSLPSSLEVNTLIKDQFIESSTSSSFFPVEIYCEFTLSNGNTYTVLNLINIYSSKTDIGNTQVVTDLVSTIPTIADNMSQAQITETLAILDKLDSITKLNDNNSKNSTTISTNSNTATGEITNVNVEICTVDSCNKRGLCLNMINSIACRCNQGYMGVNCEIASETAKVIKSITNGLANTLNKMITSAAKDDSSLLTPQLFNSVQKQIENGIKVFDNMADLNVFSDMMSNLLNTNNNSDVSQKIKENSEVIVNTINNLFKFTTLQVGKTKIDNNESKKKRNIIYNFSGQEKEIDQISNQENIKLEKIVVIESVDYNSPDHVHTDINKNNDKRRRLLRDENYITRFIQVTSNITSNSNQSQTVASDNISTSTYVDDFNLSEDQKISFIKNFYSIKKLLINLSQNIIKGYINRNTNSTNTTINNSTEILDFTQTNENFDFIIKEIHQNSLSNVSFTNLFKTRITQKQSYIDPYECLNKFISQNNQTNNNLTNNNNSSSDTTIYKNRFEKIFLVYFYIKTPIYIIDQNLSLKSLTLSHHFQFFDSNLSALNIETCGADIIHYLPFNTANTDFKQKYLMYPQKYFSTNKNLTSINENIKNIYDKFQIFSNGTVDRNSSIKYQLDKYYPQYKLNLYSFNEIINNTKNLLQDSVNENNIKYFDENDYIVASSRKVGEFSVFSEFTPPSVSSGNFFYLNKNELFTVNNIGNNTLFKILLSIICFNLGILVLMLFYSGVSGNSEDKGENEKNLENEGIILNKDNYIFGDYNRYYVEDLNNKDISKKSHNLENLNQDENIQKDELRENKNKNISKKKDYSGDNVKISVQEDIRKIANLSHIEETPGFFSLFHFVFKRNIYMNFFFLSSPLSPKSKSITKVFCLVLLMITIANLLYIFSPIQFDVNKKFFKL